MEQVKPHAHRYLYQFEMIIAFLGLALVIFGLYGTTFGQTGGWTNTNNNVDPKVRNATVSTTGGSTTGGYNAYGPTTNIDPNIRNATVSSPRAGTSGVATVGYNTYNQNTNVNNPDQYSTYYGPDTNGGTGWGQASTGGYTGGTATGGYYGSGGIYSTPGLYEQNAVPVITAGGTNTSGSAYYNIPGFFEPAPVPTQFNALQGNGNSTYTVPGLTEQTISAASTTNTNSIQHCEFITKYHKFGDRGGDVPKIQQFLKDRGYYSGRIDGVYGITTFKAVQKFQTDYKDKILDPWNFDNKSSYEGTGITNISTKYAINKIVGCPDPATIIPKTGKVLNY